MSNKITYWQAIMYGMYGGAISGFSGGVLNGLLLGIGLIINYAVENGIKYMFTSHHSEFPIIVGSSFIFGIFGGVVGLIGGIVIGAILGIFLNITKGWLNIVPIFICIGVFSSWVIYRLFFTEMLFEPLFTFIISSVSGGIGGRIGGKHLFQNWIQVTP